MANPRNILCGFLLLLYAGCGPGAVDTDRPTGTQAKAMLSATPNASLVVEVDYVLGRRPSASALALLEKRLNERCNKPAGITVVVDDALPIAQGSYDLRDLKELENSYRDYDKASLYVLYLDGTTPSPEVVLGWAYADTSIVVFSDVVARNADAWATVAEVEAAVLVHELGHVLGLVNVGTPMIRWHEDMRHPGHDTETDCVMYYAIGSSQVRSFVLQLRGPPPTQFGSYCVQDLRANGGR